MECPIWEKGGSDNLLLILLINLVSRRMTSSVWKNSAVEPVCMLNFLTLLFIKLKKKKMDVNMRWNKWASLFHITIRKSFFVFCFHLLIIKDWRKTSYWFVIFVFGKRIQFSFWVFYNFIMWKKTGTVCVFFSSLWGRASDNKLREATRKSSSQLSWKIFGLSKSTIEILKSSPYSQPLDLIMIHLFRQQMKLTLIN